MLFNLEAWLHGLFSAFITGGAGALGAAIIKPEDFNLSAGFSNLWKMALWSGIIGAATYLKQSPLPAIQDKIDSKL